MYSDCFEGPLPGDGDPESVGQEDMAPNHDGGSPEATLNARGCFSLDEVANLNTSTSNDLVRPCDIKGILHSHSRYADGAHHLDSMVSTAREIGLEYLGVSDHFLTETHTDGLSLDDMMVQRREIEQLHRKYPGFDILQGVELDVNPDGSLPLDDASLSMFDFVIAAFPENGGYDKETLTDQVVKVAGHPLVTILGRPLGDCILRRGKLLGMDRVLDAAAAGNTALELNANPNAVELDWSRCLKAQEMGIYMAISPDAHRAARLVDYRHGAERAQEAGLRCSSILNTLGIQDLKAHLAHNRTL